MVEDHPVFISPDNPDVKIWRYMDFTKLLSLIDTQRLFFARADLFNDPFEGSYPKNNIERRKNFIPNVAEESQASFLEYLKNMSTQNKAWPRYTAISCWHMNEYESAAMWSLYLKVNEGIAVQSTFNRLKKSIIDETPVHLGVVKYIDYEKDYIEEGNLYGPFVYKRKSFEHERELRAVLFKWPIFSNKMDLQKETIFDGVPVIIDIEELVEKIYIAPNAPKWFVDLVKTVIKRYGYDFEVILSDLDRSPMY